MDQALSYLAAQLAAHLPFSAKGGRVPPAQRLGGLIGITIGEIVRLQHKFS
ncbi:MAG: hypothetical protein ACREWI_10075 [Telluria sp.]